MGKGNKSTCGGWCRFQYLKGTNEAKAKLEISLLVACNGSDNLHSVHVIVSSQQYILLLRDRSVFDRNVVWFTSRSAVKRYGNSAM
jgi:hypothetical protein